MYAIPFDTLEFTEQLKAVGVPDEQAKGHVKALAVALKQTESRMDERADQRDKRSEEHLNGLATRQDMDVRFKELDVRFKEVDARFKEVDARIREVELKLVETKADIIKWVLGVSTAQTMLVVALIKLLPGGH